ncbi:MAG: hypothetical protein K1X79_11865 [Oligoflexia bacterium]|nr:hypothetical protein [Oligoflexia bacterium]
MLENLKRKIQEHSREQWIAMVQSCWNELCDWVREHGELAAVCGFLLGIFIVLAFRFVLTLLVLAAILAFVIWKVARPSSDTKSS